MYVVDGDLARREHPACARYENLEQEPLELRRLKFLNDLAAPAGAPKPLAVDQPVPDFVFTDQHRQR